jgi:tripartite-type tricarboxylate transporter receptor subunit TctC
MQFPTIARSLAGAAFAALILSSGTASAEYPEKPVTYVVPFGPGGESDISARFQQSYFKELTGQELVIQYKPGGGGAVGWSQLNGMPGDGYTIMGTNLPHIILKPMQKDVGFTTDGLTNVYFFHFTPDALVVTADSPLQTLDDYIQAAKAAPGAVTLAGSGTFSANDVAKARFDKLAGIVTTYIPFKGTGAATTALLGKQVRASWGYTTVGASQGDQVRMLAVAMEERHPSFPDVPTFKELGFDIVGGAYRGIAVPDSTPEETRQQLSDVLDAINKTPEFRQKMEEAGFALIDVPYDQVPTFMEERVAEYTEAAKDLGITK